MKILYFGSLEWGSTCLQRLEAISSLGNHIYAVDQRIFYDDTIFLGLFLRLQRRLGLGPLVRHVSSSLIREARRYQPELLWIDQGQCITAEALKKIKNQTGAFCFHYTPDSLKAPGWQNNCFSKAISEFDLCITTKPHEKLLYKQIGAQNIFLSFKGYDPRIHRPVKLSTADKEYYSCEVAFIGQRMQKRAESLVRLIENIPYSVNLYGRHWDRGDTGKKLSPYQKGWVAGESYAKALCGAKICLAFLNHEVEDPYTARSIEIPACGAFMLAQRTEKHLELYREDVEAVFFDSDVEMIDKVKFYLQHEDLRQRIAKAGYEKVIRLGFTWENLMKSCLETYAKLNNNKVLSQ